MLGLLKFGKRGSIWMNFIDFHVDFSQINYGLYLICFCFPDPNILGMRLMNLVSCKYLIYISVYKLHILSRKKNYTKHNVSSLMTILSSQNSLNNSIYIYRVLLYRLLTSVSRSNMSAGFKLTFPGLLQSPKN